MVANLFVSIFLIIWASLLAFIGINDLQKNLGGIFIVYMLIPLIPFVKNFVKEFSDLSKITWSFVLIFSGVVLINLINTVFVDFEVRLGAMALIYFLLLVFSPIIFGYMLSMYNFVDFSSLSMDRNEDEFRLLRKLSGFLIVALIWPILLSLIPVIIFKNINKVDFLGFYSLLGGIFFSCLSMLVLTFYVEKIKTKINLNKINQKIVGKFSKKSFYLFCAILIVVSFSYEVFYRKNWYLFSVSLLILILYMVYVFRMFKVCLSISSENS